MKTRSWCKDNHVYYNVIIPNAGTTPVLASFMETRTTPLVMNPSEYHLAIVRFSVPSSLVPLFLFQDGVYKVTLSYSGILFTETVQFIQTNQTDTSDRNVYIFQNFIDMVNAALLAAFNAAVIAAPGPLPDFAPELVFDTATQLTYLKVDPKWNPATLNPTLQIWFNTALYDKFGSFNVNFNGYTNALQNYQFIVEYTGGNLFNDLDYPAAATSKPFLHMMQTGVSIGYMSNVKTIVFTSTSIPGKAEYIPSITGNSNDNFRNILIDFEPLDEGNTVSNINNIYWQYYPQGPYRLVDLQSTQPITNVDLQVSWQDELGNLSPIYIAPGRSLTVKMLFQKKGGPYGNTNDEIL